MAALRTLLDLAWRNLWRNFRRTGITLVVVGVGVWSVLSFNAFLDAWITASKDEALDLLPGSAQIHAPGFLDDPGAGRFMAPPGPGLTAALDGPGVSQWAQRVTLPGVVQSEYKTLPVNIYGVQPAREKRLSTIPGTVVQGRYLTGPEDAGVVIGKHLAERLNTGLGRRVILMAPGADGTLAQQSFDVVGVFDTDLSVEDGTLFTGLSAAQSFLGVGDRIAEIVVRVDNEADLPGVLSRLNAAAPGLEVRSWRELNFFLAAMDTSMHTFIFIWLGVVFSLMAIGIVNTQLMAVFERMPEFGLLRALGMRPRSLLLLVVLESTLLVGAGVVLGALLAVLTIQALAGGIDLSAFAAALELFQGGQVLYPKFDGRAFLAFSAVIWALGVAVTLWPARRASMVSPVEAMRRRT